MKRTLEENEQIISSQRYLDDDTVEEKRERHDYVVTIYSIESCGKTYWVVTDGHHSLAAARLDEVEPEWIRPPRQLRMEYDYMIKKFGANQWLDDHQNDSYYYDVDTGEDIW